MIHKQNIKLDITRRITHHISQWKGLSTEHVDFIPGQEMGIVFAYGLPILRIEKDHKGSVNAINVRLLSKCAKSRFLARERFEVPIVKTKKGLFLEVNRGEHPTPYDRNDPVGGEEDEVPPGILILLPETTTWTIVKGLCPYFFHPMYPNGKPVVISTQLSLFKDVWTKEGILFSQYIENYTAQELRGLTGLRNTAATSNYQPYIPRVNPIGSRDVPFSQINTVPLRSYPPFPGFGVINFDTSV